MSIPRWGLLGTFLWGLLIACVFVITQTIATLLYTTVFYEEINQKGYDHFINTIQSNGDVLTVCTITTFVFTVFLIIGIIKLKKGATIKSYLYLNRFDFSSFCFWFVALSAYIVTYDYLTVAVNRPLVPDFMRESLLTASSVGWLFFAVIIAAPISEELFFRGFVFEGIKDSRLGSVSAVLITAILWSLIHTQYDFYDVIQIFIFGIILGIAKLRTKSLVLTIILHVVVNLVSTLELIYLIR